MAVPRPVLGLALAAGVLASVLAGCGSSATGGTDGTLSVVTSTNVYGDLAATVGGSAVRVTSFISDAGQDPHSYEASAHDQLALSKADVVIENGGGYDDFMRTLLDAAGGHGTLLDVVALSGKAPAGGELNEHVWYDVPTIRTLVGRLVSVLSAADRAHAAQFAANGRRLTADLDALSRTEGLMRGRYHGTGVAVTEPVPLYLLAACGLVDRTPTDFSDAVESGTGVPASVLKQTLDLFSGHTVRALVYNSQTSGAETDQVIAAAKRASVPAVPVTETLPKGDTYVGWMRANLAAVAQALR